MVTREPLKFVFLVRAQAGQKFLEVINIKNHLEVIMAKGKDKAKSEEKKKPQMNIKEKRKAKKEKSSK